MASLKTISTRQRVARRWSPPDFGRRRRLVLAVLTAALIAVTGGAFLRQIWETDFLQDQGDRRYLREVAIPAHRGMVLDRNGEPLAVSTPVDTVIANPKQLERTRDNLAAISKALGMPLDELREQLEEKSEKSFIYLRRRITPDRSDRLMEAVQRLDIKGLEMQREYRRFYPSGELTAHVVGFTDIDDAGQEGVERSYNEWLTGTPGARRVLKDGKNRVVKDVENVRAPKPGRDLVLSIDRRLQFLAYRELKAAVEKNKALGGSAVILDVNTGEVLAMVNQPSYNPNGRRDNRRGRMRNRAITDVMEPGSTVKPFVVAAALEKRVVTPTTPINTSPGVLQVGQYTVRDVHNYGGLNVTGVITKSSNIGVTKIAWMMPAEELYQTYRRLGFGQLTGSGFPAESAGQLPHFKGWNRFEHATLSFGYGLSVSTLQLAQAYAVLAADGVKRPISLIKVDQPPEGERVFSVATARAMRAMLETVVSSVGTAKDAAVKGYRVGGKTGTAKKAVAGGYASRKYQSVFAGMLPLSNPRLVMAVMIDEPSGGVYYGGKVAAPVFASVMVDAVRLLNIPPDQVEEGSPRLAGVEPTR